MAGDSERPLFLLSAGERKRREMGFETDNLEQRYISAFVSRYVYEGLPEGCPSDYIERMFYHCGGVSGKKVGGLGVILCGALPSTWSVYGTPVHWTPLVDIGTGTGPLNDRIMKRSDGPVLFDRIPMAKRIEPYLEIMRKAMNALNINLVGLTNPVMIEASPGMEMNGRIIKNNITAGDVYIPVIDKGAIGASVLDLKAQDHTANLLGVIHDMDGEILDMMGIRSSLEKASGISVEEASASDMQIGMSQEHELLRRREWLEKLNAALGTSITVRPADDGTADRDAPAEDEDEGDADRGPDQEDG